MRFSRSLLILALLSAASRLGAQPVRVVRVPDHGVQPQAAIDANGTIHLVYLTGDPQASDIWYVTSGDDGKPITKPVRVNAHAGSALALGTIRGPQMAVGRNGIVHVAWMGSNESQPKFSGQQPTMLYARLGKGGRFELEKGVIAKHAGLDGGGGIAADDAGNVFIAWHAPMIPRGDESTRRVFVARSRDDGKTFEPETVVNDDTEALGGCACCGLRILALGDGSIVGLFRTATQQVHRDTRAFTWGGDVDATPRTLDPMNSGVCLMSTYALAKRPRNSDFVAAWETSGKVRVATLDEKLRETSQAVNVSDGRKPQKHPSLAVDARGNVLVAWAVGTGWNRGGAVAWRAFDKNLKPIPDVSGEVDGLPAWSKPAAVADSHGGFVVFY